MLFMTCQKNTAVIKAMLANQQHFGRFLAPNKSGAISDVDLWRVWCLDNGAFSGFSKDKFYLYLKRLIPYQSTCQFVVVPDVPFQWEATLEKYTGWHGMIRNIGFKRAIAVQDGATVENVPWRDIDAVFIGGSTRWKREQYFDLPMFKDIQTHRDQIIREAKRRGMWIHIGRQANSRKQLLAAASMGADSVDGTGEKNAPFKEFQGWIAQTMWEINTR